MIDLYSLFPTPIIRVPADDSNYHATQREVKEALDRIHNNKDWSSVSYLYKNAKNQTLSGKTYDFIEKFNCIELKKRILQAVDSYINMVGWQGPTEFVIKQSWINIADIDDQHGHHCHPGYAISGCYYFRVNEQQGSLCFNNPNPAMMFCQFPQGALCSQTVDIVPDDGDIVLFPSWLLHSTRKNQTQDQRISVAFNIDYVSGDDIAFGLSKQSHAPYHRKEYSIRQSLKIPK